MSNITIPHNYVPRSYQLPLLRAMDQGCKRAVAVWHRRAGKDKTLINLLVTRAIQQVGTYFYFFPTYRQGKKILWNGMDRQGFRFLGHIPEEIRKRTDNQEMLIELINGSIIQIIGTDNINSIVGTNPIGCVFSEYSLQNPEAWQFIRPILAENKGWAVFNFTPRGENHAFDLWNLAQNEADWFTQLLTVEDTGAIDVDTLRNEREEIVRLDGSDALYQQEYYCSFTAPIPGAYFSKQMRDMEETDRLTKVSYQIDFPVITSWDLGIDDYTSIWFVQVVGHEIQVIDFLQDHGRGLEHYAHKLQEKGYLYQEHILPHDVEARELGTGKTRLEVLRQLLPGQNFRTIKRQGIEDGINAVRNLLPRCWMDIEKCKDGINALRSYHQEYDEMKRVYGSRPVHDWASHASDAFRYLALGLRNEYESDHIGYNTIDNSIDLDPFA